MDLALFFVLPLIGGFIFATTFDLLRYRTGREEAQRLYYRAAMIGVLLAAVGAIVHVGVHAYVQRYSVVADRVAHDVIEHLLEKERTSTTVAVSSQTLELRIDLVFACVYAFLLGSLTWLWNRLIRGADWIWIHIAPRKYRRSFLDALNLRSITDQLERLLAESLQHHSLVQITLSNSKVYVGTVLESPDPISPAKYFKIQPWMSGYRNSTDGRVTFTTYYDSVLSGLLEDESMKEAAASFQLVLPIDKVLSASGFDLTAYERFSLAPDSERTDDEAETTGESKRPSVLTAFAALAAAVLLLLSR